MAKTFRLPKEEPLLDIVSYGGGSSPDSSHRLTSTQVDHLRRTVQRTPEVVVKVLSRASNDLKAAGKHLDYIGRYGELGLETDIGESQEGGVGTTLLEEWDIDIDDMRRRSALLATSSRSPPKLIHKLMFSMPPGTPPTKVLSAVRNFARDEFYGQHRYAFVLHTDEDHPHVHMVLKAVSEQGVRLNIKKATLRSWREGFARHLRLLGVAANATERAVRGEIRSARRDGIYRASVRGDSSYLREQAEAIAKTMLNGKIRVEFGKSKLLETRQRVTQGWLHAAHLLSEGGQHDLVNQIRQFVRSMPPPRTDREQVAEGLRAHLLETREPPIGRTR